MQQQILSPSTKGESTKRALLMTEYDSAPTVDPVSTHYQGFRPEPTDAGDDVEKDQTPSAIPVTRIRASGGWRAINLAELWRYRELLYFLTLRDIKLRYKQTALGVSWAVIQPLFTTVVFVVFFGNVGGMADKTGTAAPYALFTLAALLPWQLFAYALTQSSNSLVNEQRLITKVYFPRLIVPVASVLAGVVDFFVAGGLMAAMMAWYGFAPSWGILALPVLIVFTILTALAVGLWLSVLNVQYRDVRYTLPFLTQFWLFITPVAYPAAALRDKYGEIAALIYGLNPMAGVVEGFRWALLSTTAPDWGIVGVSAGVVCILLVGGFVYFRRMEQTFADVV